jgi:hypothetical protein
MAFVTIMSTKWIQFRETGNNGYTICVGPHYAQAKTNNRQNKQNSYLLLAFLQSGSVPELDMHESKHFLPGQFIHSGNRQI